MKTFRTTLVSLRTCRRRYIIVVPRTLPCTGMREGRSLCTIIVGIQGHYVIYGGLRASCKYLKIIHVFRGTHERNNTASPPVKQHGIEARCHIFIRRYDACYDIVSTFWLNWLLEDGAPYPQIVGVSVFCRIVFIVYIGHRIAHRAPLLVS